MKKIINVFKLVIALLWSIFTLIVYSIAIFGVFIWQLIFTRDRKKDDCYYGPLN